jgi:hypothetical protein
MSLSGFDRKRVERFSEFIETANGPRTHRRTSVDDDPSSLTRLTHRLRDLPMQAPNAEFSSALRSFLVATAERDGVGRTAAAVDHDAAPSAGSPALAGKTQVVRQVSARGSSRARLAVLAGVAAGAIVLSGVSAASTGALPGDPLYSVKRSTEKAQLALAGSDASRGRLYLEFARSRLTEANQVNDPSKVSAVLADMDSEMTQGVTLVLDAVVAGTDSSGMSTLKTFVTNQQTALTQLQGTASPSDLAHSSDLLDRISGRIAVINHALAAHCTSFPTADSLGPKPADTC